MSRTSARVSMRRGPPWRHELLMTRAKGGIEPTKRGFSGRCKFFRGEMFTCKLRLFEDGRAC
jgi:hypothetical protein